MESTQGQGNWLPIPPGFTMQTVELRGAGTYCRIILTKQGDDRSAKWQVSPDGQHWTDYASKEMIIAGQTWTLQPDGKLLGRC